MRQDEKQPCYIHGFIATRYDAAVALSAQLQPDADDSRTVSWQRHSVAGSHLRRKRCFVRFLVVGSWLSLPQQIDGEFPFQMGIRDPK